MVTTATIVMIRMMVTEMVKVQGQAVFDVRWPTGGISFENLSIHP